MADDARQHRLHVFRHHMRARIEQRPRARGLGQRQRGARRQAADVIGAAAGVADQRLHVIEQRIGHMHLLRFALQGQQFGGLHAGLNAFQQIAAVFAAQQRALGLRAGIAQLNTHQKAVELRFR